MQILQKLFFSIFSTSLAAQSKCAVENQQLLYILESTADPKYTLHHAIKICQL